MKFDDLMTALSVIAVVVLGVIGQTWAVMKWFNNKIETKHDTHNNAIFEINRRIDEVKDNYVRRSDLDRDLKSLANSLEQLQVTLNQSLEATNSRLEEHMKANNARLDKILLAVSARRDM